MSDRYRKLLAWTSLSLALALLGPTPPAQKPSAICGANLSALYSPRALRRMRTALELKQRELHRERLALIQAVIEHRLTIARYLALTSSAPTTTNGCAVRRAEGTFASEKPFG